MNAQMLVVPYVYMHAYTFKKFKKEKVLVRIIIDLNFHNSKHEILTYNGKFAAIVTNSAMLSPRSLAVSVENSAAGDRESLDSLECDPTVSVLEPARTRRSLQRPFKLEFYGRLARAGKHGSAQNVRPFRNKHFRRRRRSTSLFPCLRQCLQKKC